MPDAKSEKKPVEPRLASTILLLRDGPATLEVFMVERHHQIDFATGALVFPGGKLEDADGDAALVPFCRTHPAASADSSARQRALCVGAIRETFEECGVLLARAQGREELIDAARLATLDARYREPLQNDTCTMLEFVQAEHLELAFDRLVPFAHWITPDFMPKRFDTHFFLVEAPADQLAVHDGTESVDSLWTTIPDALELEASGRRTIVFPTLENIKKLGRSGSVVEALAAARSDTIVTVLPRLSKDASGELMMELPAEAGYDTVRAPMSSLAGGLPAKGKGS